MPRHSSKKTPLVISGFLYTDDPRSTGIALDTQPWFDWLQAAETSTFYFQGTVAGFTARREVKQRGTFYWIAYRRVHGQLRKVYLGTAHQLTRLRLEQVLAHLCLDESLDNLKMSKAMAQRQLIGWRASPWPQRSARD